MCGRCCHDNAVPLTIAESISWLEDNGKVDLYVEADPWPVEPSSDNRRAAHRKRRSFQAPCGSSTARITVILVASFSGPCKNLGPDMRCRIYATRPLVCAIYPSEISPFIQLDTASKRCPPEAWGVGETILNDAIVHALVETSRQTDQDDAPLKSLLCSELNIDVAAIAGEGFIVYERDPKHLLEALRHARAADPATLPVVKPWIFYSKVPEQIEWLGSHGFEGNHEKRSDHAYTFLWSQARTAVRYTPVGFP
jgi:Fe-S-cluster containining protein